jgi:aromatic-amino-acid transaminase
VLAQDGETLGRVMSNGCALARAAWSMPPDHGAAAVRLILEDAKLTAMWLDELEQMRTRIRQVRDRLGAAGQVGSVDLGPLAKQNGMFAMLPLDKDQIAALRSDHGIYMAGSGRINVAGLTIGNIDKFIEAVRAVAS